MGGQGAKLRRELLHAEYTSLPEAKRPATFQEFLRQRDSQYGQDASSVEEDALPATTSLPIREGGAMKKRKLGDASSAEVTPADVVNGAIELAHTLRKLRIVEERNAELEKEKSVLHFELNIYMAPILQVRLTVIDLTNLKYESGINKHTKQEMDLLDAQELLDPETMFKTAFAALTRVPLAEWIEVKGWEWVKAYLRIVVPGIDRSLKLIKPFGPEFTVWRDGILENATGRMDVMFGVTREKYEYVRENTRQIKLAESASWDDPSRAICSPAAVASKHQVNMVLGLSELLAAEEEPMSELEQLMKEGVDESETDD